MGRLRRLPGLVATAIVLASCVTEAPPSPSPSATSTPDVPTATAASPSSTPNPTDPPVGAARWERIDLSGRGPSPRSSHTWTGDPSTGIAYLFGGRGTAGPLGDLWRYDLAADTWTQAPTTADSPPPRSGHAAAWIDGLGLVVFGGQGEAGVDPGMWAYEPDAGAWRVVDVAGATPPARTEACSAMRPDGRWWVSHGSGDDGSLLADTWVYDPGPSSWTKITAEGSPPPPLTGSVCWWAGPDRFVLVGGRDDTGTARGEGWVLTATDGKMRWDPLPDPLPPTAAPAGVDTAGGLLLMGGIGPAGTPLADLVEVDRQDLSARSFTPADVAPTARSAATLVDDPGGERVLLFGGLGTSGPDAELWSVRLP